MRRLLVLLVLLALPVGALADDVGAIHQRYADWVDGFNAGRTELACDLFAADLAATDRGQPERGYQEVCALVQDSLSDPARDYRYRIDIIEVLVEDNLAIVRADWSLFITPFNINTTERAMDILRRESDGAWRIVRSQSYDTP